MESTTLGTVTVPHMRRREIVSCACVQFDGVPYSGFDLHRNTTQAWEYVGKYATDVFTDEAVDLIQQHDKTSPLFLYLAHLAVHSGNRGKYMEAPQEYVDRFPHIMDPNRRTYAGTQ